MKNCPFCKKSISENQDSCPYCYRVLVERIKPKVIPAAHINKTAGLGIFKSKFKNFFKSVNRNLTSHDRDVKKYFPEIVLVLFVAFVFIISDNNDKPVNNSKPVPVIPVNTDTVKSSEANTVSVKDPKDYNSLGNGTKLSNNPIYFKGDGELEIDNGTSLDAIAKLVNINTNKSIITVYIKARSVYNITEISDGDYKLFFNLGNDWDDKLKAFSVNSSYEVFEEKFDYKTTATQYQTFSVTLNPVVNGQAETNEVNPVEFGNY